MKKNKKIILIIVAVLVFVVIFFSWFFDWGNKQEGGVTPKPLTPTPKIAKVELSDQEEPKVELEIQPDRSGAVLLISSIDQRFDQLEYELIYLAESEGQEIERGVAGGPIEIASSRKIREDILFGTESCTTGTCRRKIDKNVSQGRLIIHLATPEGSSWSVEREFSIEKATSGYQAVWKD